MQWEGTAPVIEIEKGRRRPRPETLNALGEALQFSPADIAYLQGLAGYREPTVMPPLEHIKRVLQAIAPDISRRLYPVYVMDYQFRHWLVNTATAALLGGSLDLLREWMRRGVHGFNVVFDARLAIRSYFAQPEAVERERLFRFKSYNLYRRREPFYLAYPQCMKRELLPEDYARFANCWNEVEFGLQAVYPIYPRVTIQAGSHPLTFEIHVVELLQLDRLLFVSYYEPKDDHRGNRERCQAFFTQHGPTVHECICVWDA